MITACVSQILPSRKVTDCAELAPVHDSRYYKGMKANTKSSITLPPHELQLVLSLQKKLRARSKVEVVRRGLLLLREATDRESLRQAYRQASHSTRTALAAELRELDHLSAEGLERG